MIDEHPRRPRCFQLRTLRLNRLIFGRNPGVADDGPAQPQLSTRWE